MVKVNIKSSLLFLTIVPIVIIFIFSIIGVRHKYVVIKNLEETKRQIEEANRVTQVVHFMQIERGVSTGYTANTQKIDSNSMLVFARGNLDMTIKNTKDGRYTDLLKDVTKTRESINRFEISASQVQKNYTQYISTLLDSIMIMPTMIEDRDDRNYIQVLSYLSSAKEYMGQIRAILQENLVSKTLSKENFIHAKESLKMYHDAIKRFEKSLNEYPEFLNFYQNSFKNSAIQETFNIVDLLDKNSNELFSIDNRLWFETASKSIDVHKEVQQRLFLYANNSIDKKIKEGKEVILYVYFALLLLFLVIVFFMSTTVKKILSSTHMLSEEFESSLALLEQYKLTVDESFVVSKTDAKGIIRYANDAFCKISGYTREELVGKPHNIVRHPDMPKEVFKDMWHTIKDLRKPWIGEVKNLAKDGCEYWMKVFINPIVDKNGDVIEYIAMRADITDMQNEKERIRDSLGITIIDYAQARHLAREYENAIDATWSVIRTDADNVIIYTNETFEEFSGYTKEELIGKNCNDIRSQKHIQNRDCEKINKRLAQKEIVNIQFENIAKDKKPYYMDTTIVPIADNKGNIVEYLHLMCDITELILLHTEIEKTQQEIIFRMGEIGESRSKETGNHVRRVAEYSKLLALKIGFNDKEAELVADASAMHDIGKVAIPDSILLKNGSLDEMEWRVMQTHSAIGYKVLNGSNRDLLNAAAVIAHEHHEKYDGSGYPNNKAGKDIHIYARIVAIADVFDALGSDRVYKRAWENEKIFNFFETQKGKHFDPKLTELFLGSIDEFLEIRDRYKDMV